MLDTAAPADHRNVGDWERVASGLGGAALIAYAAARPSLAGVLMAVGGAMLLERGITGECPLSRALGASTRGGARPRVTHGEGKRGAYSIQDEIDRASYDSFPASDPPFWSPHTIGAPAVIG